MKHIFPTELINRVLNYLSTKPYAEVNQLINELKASAVQMPEGIEITNDPAPCEAPSTDASSQ